MTEYLLLDDALHVVARYGFHVRDVGLVASALARPGASAFGADAYGALETKAAALLESLIRNHALVDGNKRTAWTLTMLFVWINGYRHDFTPDAAFELVMDVAGASIDLNEAAHRISGHLVPRL